MTTAEKIAEKLNELLNNNPDISNKQFKTILDQVKRKFSKQDKCNVPRNSDILKYISEENKKLRKLLIKVPSRTMSGVTPLAVMTVSGCPHGKCAYCPRGKNAAQSYTGEEPASLRARQNVFDPYMQVKARLRQYKELGHPTDKIELIIMGGTFLAQNSRYKENYVLRLYEALNEQPSTNLHDARKVNESANHRIVGLTIETRPDWCFEKHINEMLKYGTTRVELGVQTLSDFIYEKVDRGHTIKDVVKATQLLKDSGFKIVYHMMPGLFSTEEQDVEYIKQLFEDQRFQPDMLKIYPTMVMKNTKLYDLWEKGEYTPYNSEQAAKVIAHAMQYVPEYVRIMRIQRDIPAQLICSGVKKSNLRQLVEKVMETENIKPREIRSREVGIAINTYKKELKLQNCQTIIRKYNASQGIEYFISYEDLDDDVILGFIRLRIPGNPFRTEITKNTGIIRELHIYGSEVGIGLFPNMVQAQHKGIGKMLLEKAEDIAKENGMKDMIVIAGTGVKPYYYKFGYVPKGPYVHKEL